MATDLELDTNKKKKEGALEQFGNMPIKDRMSTLNSFRQIASSREQSPSVSGEVLSGAMAGAATLNPYAIAAGAAIGLVKGVVGSRRARKKAQGEAEASKHMAQADIEDDKASRIQGAISQLSNAFSGSFR